MGLGNSYKADKAKIQRFRATIDGNTRKSTKISMSALKKSQQPAIEETRNKSRLFLGKQVRSGPFHGKAVGIDQLSGCLIIRPRGGRDRKYHPDYVEVV
ncbi:MAG: hypothetical protein JWO43_504 [Candidatus Adlerbacteria bacterium]|nr:hypothetical protein [Candidatus Adlerbacteria bacterium]